MEVSIPLRSDFNVFSYLEVVFIRYVSIPLRSDFNDEINSIDIKVLKAVSIPLRSDFNSKHSILSQSYTVSFQSL